MEVASVDSLREAVEHLHGCKALFVESVPVREMYKFADQYKGVQVWAGDVAVFDLTEHPKATRVYVWSEATTGTKRGFFAVLHVPPIISPLDAVRASIVADAKAAFCCPTPLIGGLSTTTC